MRTFPEMITDLPAADIPIAGLDAWLLQCCDKQVLFMKFDEDAAVPEHSHEAQWGVILAGEIDLTISGKKHIFRKGDTYHIPKGVAHSAVIKKGYADITVFDQKDRYRPKV